MPSKDDARQNIIENQIEDHRLRKKLSKRVPKFRSLRTKISVATLLLVLLISLASALVSAVMIETIIGWEAKQDSCTIAKAEAQNLDAEETLAFAREVTAIYDSLTESEKQNCDSDIYKAKFAHLINEDYYGIKKRMYLTGEGNDFLNCCIFFVDHKKNRMVYILDSDPNEKTFCPPGSWDAYSESQIEAMEHGAKLTIVERILGLKESLRTIWDNRSTGIMCSGFATVGEVEGHEIMVCLDQRITHMSNLQKSSRVILAVFLLLISVGASIMAGLSLYRTIVRPINKMAVAAQTYSEEKKELGGSSSRHFANLNIHTHDEIENLSQVMQEMEDDIADYIGNITSITAEKERINTELSVATQIQAAMLPSEFPAFPDRQDFDIYASMNPAKEVGGDFYDYFLVDENHLCLVMADVSGKGIPAALFMMAARILLAEKIKSGLSLAEALAEANNAICANNMVEMFVTVWVGILDLTTGKVTASNAGHEKPVVIHPDGRAEIIRDKHGFVIGGLEDMQYTEYELQLEPGARLFLYTDGVPEATASDNQMFGLDRMIEAVTGKPELTPQQTLQQVRKAVDAFVGDAEQFDDLTMLCVKLK